MATLSEKILSKSIILKRIRSQSLLRASIHSGFQTLAGHTSFPSCRLWLKHLLPLTRREFCSLSLIITALVTWLALANEKWEEAVLATSSVKTSLTFTELCVSLYF